MNKEKLIDIILKEIDELKEIAIEIEKGNSVVKLETDIALSKATLILQEFQLLKEKYIVESPQLVVKEVVNPVLSELQPMEEPDKEQPAADVTFEVAGEEQETEEEFTERVHEPILILDEEAEEGDDDTSEGDDDDSEENDDDSEGDDDSSVGDDNGSVGDDDGSEEDDDRSEGDDDDSEEEDDISEEEDGDSDKEEEEEEEEEDDDDDDDDDFEEDDDEKFEDDEDLEEEEESPDEDGLEEEEDDLPQTGKTVGENFQKEKSVNDIIGNTSHANDTLDQKFSHGPIASLQAAIGINDRFLFIREIFNNDAQLYATAIKRLDGCADIREAVDYLSSNFRIKKTETSLKFVELIKRRFAK